MSTARARTYRGRYTVGGMRAPTGTGTRLTRALALGGSGTLVGAVAHVHAGASAHVGVTPVVGALLVLVLSWTATARRVTWPVIALLIGAGQLTTHVTLSAGSATAGHGHAAVLPSLSAPSAASTELPMLVLHGLAWALLTVVFTVGERALWRSVHRLLNGLPNAVPLPRHRQAVGEPSRVRSPLAHGRVLGRAPPVL